MMLIGNKAEFAIEIEISSIVDTWTFGRFFLWINGELVGDRDNYSVDLKGCLAWLKDTLKNARNRYEPDLYEMDREEVFLRLASSVLANEDGGLVDEFYENTFSRFHISHIGMSSFDCVTLLFLKNEVGLERLVWKTKDGEVMDARFGVNTIESVIDRCIRVAEQEVFRSDKY